MLHCAQLVISLIYHGRAKTRLKGSAVSVFVKGDRTNLPLFLAAAVAAAGLDIVMAEHDA